MHSIHYNTQTPRLVAAARLCGLVFAPEPLSAAATSSACTSARVPANGTPQNATQNVACAQTHPPTIVAMGGEEPSQEQGGSIPFRSCEVLSRSSKSSRRRSWQTAWLPLCCTVAVAVALVVHQVHSRLRRRTAARPAAHLTPHRSDSSKQRQKKQKQFHKVGPWVGCASRGRARSWARHWAGSCCCHAPLHRHAGVENPNPHSTATRPPQRTPCS